MRPKLLLMFAQALWATPATIGTNWPPWWSSSTPPLCCTTTWWTSRPCAAARQTANALFGNAASVLVGDFLYSRAFQMMVSVNRMRVLEVLAEATNVIAEGEVLQLLNVHDPDTTVEQYLRVIRFKTAKLFEASARLGAMLSAMPRPPSRKPVPPTVAPWAPPSNSSTTCSTTKAVPSCWARTSATTCAKASPRLPLLLAMQMGSADQDGQAAQGGARAW